MALASSLQGGASSVSHHVGIAYGLEHFRIFCFVSRPLANKKIEKMGGCSAAPIYFCFDDLWVFYFKEKDLQEQKPAAGGPHFFLHVSQKLLGTCFQ